MNARTRTLAATAALMLGFGLAGTGTAHARPRPPGPKNADCIYEGHSYSHGGVREQTVGTNNGSTATIYFECVNGRWFYREFERPTGHPGDDPTKRPGGPPRG